MMDQDSIIEIFATSFFFHSAFEQFIMRNDKMCQKNDKKYFFHVQSDFWESGPFTIAGTSQIATIDRLSGISIVLCELDVPIMSNSDCDAVYGLWKCEWWTYLYW